MKIIVLDVSIALGWFLPGEANDQNETVRTLIEGGTKALVPSIWPLEIANVLLVAERRKRISPVDTGAIWAAFQKLPIEIDAETGRRAGIEILALARQQHLSVYDAAYLELAVRHRIPLASLDELLRKAVCRLKAAVLPEKI